MKKWYLVFAALVAMFAFGVLDVALASAVTFLLAEWLVKGIGVTASLNIEGEGEILLEDTKGGLFLEAAAVSCSGIGLGTIGPESLGVGSEVLTLSGGVVSTTPLSGSGLTCTDTLNCAEPDKVWGINLPWDTEVELVEDGGAFFAALILPHSGATTIGWEVECFGVSDECTSAEGAAQLTLEGATLVALGNPAFLELIGELKPANCTRGGAGTGIVESIVPGPIKLVGSMEELSVSSEGVEA